MEDNDVVAKWKAASRQDKTNAISASRKLVSNKAFELSRKFISMNSHLIKNLNEDVARLKEFSSKILIKIREFLSELRDWRSEFKISSC